MFWSLMTSSVTSDAGTMGTSCSSQDARAFTIDLGDVVCLGAFIYVLCVCAVVCCSSVDCGGVMFMSGRDFDRVLSLLSVLAAHSSSVYCTCRPGVYRFSRVTSVLFFLGVVSSRGLSCLSWTSLGGDLENALLSV